MLSTANSPAHIGVAGDGRSLQPIPSRGIRDGAMATVSLMGVGGVLVAFEWRFGGMSGVIGNITPLVKALCHKG